VYYYSNRLSPLFIIRVLTAIRGLYVYLYLIFVYLLIFYVFGGALGVIFSGDFIVAC